MAGTTKTLAKVIADIVKKGEALRCLFFVSNYLKLSYSTPVFKKIQTGINFRREQKATHYGSPTYNSQ